MKVNHIKLEKLLDRAYNQKLALYVWGAPGIGKSTVVKDYCDKHKLELNDIRISQLDPSDLRGLPQLLGESTKWCPPSWLPRDGEGILFFDELNLAAPMVQAAAYQLILDRELGDYKLPEGWVVIAAGNRLEDRANVFELSSPLANRFLHAELEIPSAEDWTEWAGSRGVSPGIIAFINWKQSHLFRFDENQVEKAFPTPRSWEFASRLLNDKDDFEMTKMVVASAVGDGTAAEYVAFEKLRKKVDLKKILEKPELIKQVEELSMKFAIVSALGEGIAKAPSDADKYMKVMQYVEPEFAIMFLRMIKGDVKVKSKAVASPTFRNKLAGKYIRYLK